MGDSNHAFFLLGLRNLMFVWRIAAYYYELMGRAPFPDVDSEIYLCTQWENGMLTGRWDGMGPGSDSQLLLDGCTYTRLLMMLKHFHPPELSGLFAVTLKLKLSDA